MNVDKLLEEYDKKLEHAHSSWKKAVDYVYEKGGPAYPEFDSILNAQRINVAKIEGAIEVLKRIKGVD